jgi:hypothetical protein
VKLLIRDSDKKTLRVAQWVSQVAIQPGCPFIRPGIECDLMTGSPD